MWETFQLKCVSPCIYRDRSAKLQSRVNAIKLIFSKFDSTCHGSMSFLANSIRHRHVAQWNGEIFPVKENQFSEISQGMILLTKLKIYSTKIKHTAI
jgi:hypothetical protein